LVHAKRSFARSAAVLAASILWLVAAIPALAADTLTPTPVNVSLVAGTSTTVNKTLALDGLPARADIIVAIDTTFSMATPIAQAQADASNLCSQVKGSIPGARFSAVDFEDYPGMPLGGPGDTPYTLLTPGFISDCTVFAAAIATMVADGGGDGPEAYNRTFFEAYSDAAYAAPAGAIPWPASSWWSSVTPPRTARPASGLAPTRRPTTSVVTAFRVGATTSPLPRRSRAW
jgi:hypothetical protein